MAEVIYTIVLNHHAEFRGAMINGEFNDDLFEARIQMDDAVVAFEMENFIIDYKPIFAMYFPATWLKHFNDFRGRIDVEKLKLQESK